MTSVRSVLRVLACTLPALAGMLSAPAAAQAWPSKPLRWIVPFPAGGGTDSTSRVFVQKLSENIGQPVIVDNRPGGGTIIGSELAARAPADGHTVLMVTDFHSINAASGMKLPYDSQRDFTFVSRLVDLPWIMVATPGSKLGSVRDLVSAARARPGALGFASLGPSSPHFLAFEWFKRVAGIEVLDVPYKGTAAATTDFLGGQVNLTWMGVPNALRFAGEGKAVMLGVTSEKRHPLASAVAAIAEEHPEFVISTWYGMAAPAGLPREIATRMSAEFLRVLRDASVVEKLAPTGVYPAHLGPEEFAVFMRRDMERYKRMIEIAGVKLENFR